MRNLLLALICFFGAALPVSACPNYDLPAAEAYEATGGQLRAARAFPVVAGGENLIWDCEGIKPGTDQGAGYFTAQPDFSFDISDVAGLQVVISATSSCDSALLINTSSANWYYDDDDNGNLDPRIVLTRPADGRIDIWMGTYDGAYCDAELQVEALPK